MSVGVRIKESYAYTSYAYVQQQLKQELKMCAERDVKQQWRRSKVYMYTHIYTYLPIDNEHIMHAYYIKSRSKAGVKYIYIYIYIK